MKMAIFRPNKNSDKSATPLIEAHHRGHLLGVLRGSHLKLPKQNGVDRTAVGSLFCSNKNSK